ncbi:cation:H+ antiporter [Allopseudospirillum japonicum]|uniref:Cation:H+ antiporter n=1 Tax=Allopseudospirillum japonicum TaxID=64971 RepID=A0A1H6QDP4_9GAMM|nr:calcium/sodium antiporter [Allopseudospirillum japonicum]SEI39986.1 cation:H+ antiporter [Allopseudospirillum japonicum]
MLYALLALAAGLPLLIWSADRFIGGAAATARNAGMSPLLIGMTIVSIGTSAPEILVSTMAAFEGNGGLAIGNALGSNIANIGLVLGITALIAPIPINRQLMNKEVPLLLAVTLLAGYTLYDGVLTLMDAVLLFAALGVTLWLLFRNPDVLEANEDDEIPDYTPRQAWIWLVIGLVLLIASSRLLVWGAVIIAQELGVSDLIIGLTIVAIGTSLPELAASVASALKGHHDIAIGNVIGSNTFNLLAVLPIPGLVAQTSFEAAAFSRDYLSVFILTALLAIFLLWRRHTRLTRFEGFTFVGIYIAYLAWLYRDTLYPVVN